MDKGGQFFIQSFFNMKTLKRFNILKRVLKKN